MTLDTIAVHRAHARPGVVREALPPLEPSPRFFAEDEPRAGHAALRAGAPAPASSQRAELAALDAKIAALSARIEERRAVAESADGQLQELHLRPTERFVWLAPVLGGDAELATRGAVLRAERNCADRELKHLRASLAKVLGRRDELLAGALAGTPAWDKLSRTVDDARAVAKKLDATEDAVFRALAKIAPSTLVGERTHGGTTLATVGPMNLSQKIFLDTAYVYALDLQAALSRREAAVDRKFEIRERTTEELTALRDFITGARERLAPELHALEAERRAMLESAAAAL